MRAAGCLSEYTQALFMTVQPRRLVDSSLLYIDWENRRTFVSRLCSRCGQLSSVNFSQTGERINFRSYILEFSERLRGEKEAGGSRPQTGLVTDLIPSIQTGCLSVVVPSCSSETLTPCQTCAWSLLANPPSPQAMQDERFLSIWLDASWNPGWVPVVESKLAQSANAPIFRFFFFCGEDVMFYETTAYESNPQHS